MTARSVSVILPVRGDAPYLRRAMQSLIPSAAHIAELVVIDDGMSDMARDALNPVIAQLPHRLCDGPRKNPAAARNVGILTAEHPLIAFIDDDDLWPAGKLSWQCRWLDSNPQETACGGRIEWFDTWDDDKREPVRNAAWQSVVHVNLGAYVFRRETFEQIGMLDETHLFAEDVDLMLRMADSTLEFSILDRTTLYYRRHPGSMTAGHSHEEQRDFRRALFRSTVRRRERGPESRRDLNARLVRAPTHEAKP